MRNEKEIFKDLDLLCSTPGYAHVIAYFCCKDNVISYGEKLTPKNVMSMYSSERLIRTEISTLIGLLYKYEISLSIPQPNEMEYLIKRTDSLLKEIHYSISVPALTNLENNNKPFENGLSMREPIFYDGESSYIFQYFEFSEKKYLKDSDWFIKNKGFTIQDAIEIFKSISNIQNTKLKNNFKNLRMESTKNWTMLPAFIFNINEIIDSTNLERNIVENVIHTFTPPEGMYNQDFVSLNDFNIVNAYPIIKINDNEYLLFEQYNLAEALYETPFYWMNNDNMYRNVAMKNRGEFTETFCAEKLKLVFGKQRVYSNINIIDSKKNKAGEIDVLVLFADRAIILQAKSKRLTLEARSGNDRVLKDDFKKSIQDSYDQALSCSKLITDKNYKLVDNNFIELNLTRKFKEIYIFCVISDHYPALSFQTHQYLRYEQSETIMAPFIMDIFLLDVMSEMLSSPILFLSYINRRVTYIDKVIASNELTILSYHLLKNLWIDSKYSMYYLGEDISVDLDAAMMVRRAGIPGNDTPEGILTKIKDTSIGKLLKNIEMYEDSGIIDLGFLLLQLSEESMIGISKSIDMILKLAKNDGNHHDFSVAFDNISAGITFHCNDKNLDMARLNLEQHCIIKKYSQKAKNWFGICINPNNFSIRFGLKLSYEWQRLENMDVQKNYSKGKEFKDFNFDVYKSTHSKVGRNDLCPCGSGKKYKKCCGI